MSATRRQPITGYRTMTGAQRYNARMDRLLDECREAKTRFNLSSRTGDTDSSDSKGAKAMTNAELYDLVRKRPEDTQTSDNWQPIFSSWRHGGWYVDNLRYPSGAVGCVSRNYPDKKWRIACDPRPFESQPTFKSRIDAARGERDLIASLSQ